MWRIAEKLLLRIVVLVLGLLVVGLEQRTAQQGGSLMALETVVAAEKSGSSSSSPQWPPLPQWLRWAPPKCP